AKSDDFQCLISESDCPFGSRECQSCPISIPNIYTLNSIGRRINKKISEFAEKFPHTAYKAEKIRLANQLYIERDLLKEAISTFGRERVDRFIDGGIDGINERLKSLPSFKDYITIRNIGD